MRIPSYTLLVVLILMIFSCNSGKQQYTGDSMLNYPDMEMILQDYLHEYQKSPYTFLKIEMSGGKKDSTYVQASEIDWDEINTLFRKANLYDKKYENEYRITVMSDTLNPMMTLLYTSLDPKNYTQNLSIHAETIDNKIKSIYFETLDNGFFSSTEQKILFVTGRTLQIQQFSKKPFSALKKKITQYVFLNS